MADAATFIDFYALLEVAPSAQHDELRAAYRTKIAKVHPDRPGSTELDLETTKLLNIAKEILLDPDRRTRYDKERQRRLEKDPKSVSVPKATPGGSSSMTEASILLTLTTLGWMSLLGAYLVSRRQRRRVIRC